MRATTSLLAVLVSVFATGCPLVTVEAELTQVCSTRHDLAVDPAPADLGPITVEVDVELALEELEALRSLDADVRIAHVRLRPTSGIDDLAFVDAAQILVASADPDAPLPTLELASCAGDCPADGVDLLFPAELDVDAVDYVDAGPLVVDATLDGELPTVAWTVDVEVCARGTASATGSL